MLSARYSLRLASWEVLTCGLVQAAEKLQLEVETPTYQDAQRKLQLLEQQYANILF